MSKRKSLRRMLAGMLTFVIVATGSFISAPTVKADDIGFSFDINYPGVWDIEDWSAREEGYKDYVSVSYCVTDEQVDDIYGSGIELKDAPYNWIRDEQLKVGDWVYVEAYVVIEGYHIESCRIGSRMDESKQEIVRPNDDRLFCAWYKITENGEYAFSLDVTEGEDTGDRFRDGTEFSFDIFDVSGNMPENFGEYGVVEYNLNNSPNWHEAHQNWIDDFVCQGDCLRLRVTLRDGFDIDRERGITLGLRAWGEEPMDITEEALSEDGYEFNIEEIAEYSFSLRFVYDESWTGVDRIDIVNAKLAYETGDNKPVYSAKAADDTPDFDVIYEGWIAGSNSKVDVKNPNAKFEYGLEYSYVIEIQSRGRVYFRLDENSTGSINGIQIANTPDYSMNAWNDSNGTHIIVTGFAKYNPRIDLSKCTVTPKKTSYIYTGKSIKPAVTVKMKDGTVVNASNYTVSYSNNKNAGKAKIRVSAKGNATTGSISKIFTIKKATQKPTIKPKTKTVKAGGKTSITVKKAYGKIKYTYKKEVFIVSGKTIKVKDNAKAGTYTITAKVAGDKNHEAKTVKFKVTVR